MFIIILFIILFVLYCIFRKRKVSFVKDAYKQTIKYGMKQTLQTDEDGNKRIVLKSKL